MPTVAEKILIDDLYQVLGRKLIGKDKLSGTDAPTATTMLQMHFDKRLKKCSGSSRKTKTTSLAKAFWFFVKEKTDQTPRTDNVAGLAAIITGWYNGKRTFHDDVSDYFLGDLSFLAFCKFIELSEENMEFLFHWFVSLCTNREMSFVDIEKGDDLPTNPATGAETIKGSEVITVDEAVTWQEKFIAFVQEVRTLSAPAGTLDELRDPLRPTFANFVLAVFKKHERKYVIAMFRQLVMETGATSIKNARIPTIINGWAMGKYIPLLGRASVSDEKELICGFRTMLEIVEASNEWIRDVMSAAYYRSRGPFDLLYDRLKKELGTSQPPPGEKKDDDDKAAGSKQTSTAVKAPAEDSLETILQNMTGSITDLRVLLDGRTIQYVVTDKIDVEELKRIFQFIVSVTATLHGMASAIDEFIPREGSEDETKG